MERRAVRFLRTDRVGLTMYNPGEVAGFAPDFAALLVTTGFAEYHEPERKHEQEAEPEPAPEPAPESEPAPEPQAAPEQKHEPEPQHAHAAVKHKAKGRR